MIEVALRYARNGWSILPLHCPQGSGCSCGKANCSKRGKHSCIGAWQNNASTDADLITQWWTQWPDANIGLRLDGLLVLDVDTKNGGFESLEKLEKLEKGQPGAQRMRFVRPSAETGSGGAHYFFRAREGVGKRISFRPGLDLLTGPGSYVVVAPSVHRSGNQYAWYGEPNPLQTARHEIALQAAPQWLIDAATERPKTKSRSRSKSTANPQGRVPAERILNSALERVMAGAGRNDTGFWLFCQFRDNGYTEAEAQQHLDTWVRRANATTPGQEPYAESEAKLSLQSAYQGEPREAWETDSKRANVAQVLAELSAHVELFHTAKRDPFALVPVDEHVECYSVTSNEFKDLLNYWYYRKRGNTPGRDSLKSFIDVLSTRAKHEGTEKRTYFRIAHENESIYLDLGNSKFEVVEINADGWRILSRSPVCFRRAPGMEALPRPQVGGSLDLLRPLINAREHAHWVLMLGWLCGVFLEHGGIPILLVQGVQGSAKTTTSENLRKLVDPAVVLLPNPSKDERELAIYVVNSGIVGFDNLSGAHPWLSDALCRISTGSGLRTRSLYTNDDEHLFELHAPILANGIDDIGTRADLIDRSISIALAYFPDEERLTVQDVQARFTETHGLILGALLTAISAGLKNLSDVTLSKLPRMADFARWVVACEPALPLKPGEFLRYYLGNRQEAMEVSVENDPVAKAVMHIARGTARRWEGRAEALLTELNRKVPIDQRPKSWPCTPASLGRWLRRAEASLRASGIVITNTRKGVSGTRMVCIECSPVQGKLADWSEREAA